MCKEKGIAATYSNFTGRIKNIRVNQQNEIIADFYERTSQTPSVVNANELKFPNKKAEKTFKAIFDTLNKKHIKPEKLKKIAS